MNHPCLEVIFQSLREEFDRQYDIKDPGKEDPDRIAFQKAVYGLRCPVSALVVHLPGKVTFWGGAEGDVVSYVRLDLETPGTANWTFLGEASSDEVLSNLAIARSLLLKDPDSDYLEALAKGTTMGASDHSPDWLMIAVAGDIRTCSNIDAWLAIETFMVDFQPRLVSRAGTKLEFEKVYSLMPGAPQTAAQLLTSNRLGTPIVPNVSPEDFDALTRHAEAINGALLIPKVPEEVAKTFEMARQLYIYSCFHHWLSTAAHHYLFLAIEAAVKHRWCATLTNPVIVTSKKGATISLHRPHHQDFFEIRAKHNNDKDWDYRNIKVNGRCFEPSTEKLIDALGEAGLLSKWQQRRLKGGVRLRNHFSHRESGILIPVGADRFIDIARDLNYLFHTL